MYSFDFNRQESLLCNFAKTIQTLKETKGMKKMLSK